MKKISHSVYDEEKGILVGRIAAGEDLLTGIKKELKKHGITSGTLTCLGSLSKVAIAQFEYVENELAYSKPVIWDGPVEILAGNGIIGVTEEGELDIHYHGVIMDHKKSLSGGHFLEGNNIVAITVEFTVMTSTIIQPQKQFDETLGFSYFQFHNRGEM